MNTIGFWFGLLLAIVSAYFTTQEAGIFTGITISVIFFLTWLNYWEIKD